jgi:hypothetical protein
MGQKLRISMSLAVVCLTAMAAPASAQQYLYYNACGGARGNAALTVCASADLSLVGTTLRMRVWNMETDGASGLSSYSSPFGGWHTIISVGLEYMGSGTAGSGDLASARYVFGAGPGGVQNLFHWQSVSAPGGANPLRVELGSITDGHNEGIIGCTDPGPAAAGHVQTCNSYGFSPYVVFTFSDVDPSIDFADYNFEFYSAQIADGYFAKPSASGVSLPPGSVVPEPITMVLLGSGLLGVGGVNFRRRRKNSELVPIEEG